MAPGSEPAPEDALVETLISIGGLDTDVVRRAQDAQRDLAARGQPVGLGDLLVREGRIDPEVLGRCRAQARAPAGRPFGRYVLLSELGRGGMGVVWKAWDPVLERAVALKWILREAGDEAIERFARESRAAARLRHPNVVQVFDVGVCEGQPYFTCEYVPGRTFEEAMRAGMKPVDGIRALCAVAEALEHAHREGIVHRDVKPSNVMIDGSGRPSVMDFGLAKDVSEVVESGATVAGTVMGTPRYMSPEQASGDAARVGPATDQYSVGVILYELLAGRPPHAATSLPDLLVAIAKRPPLPPGRVRPGVHRDLEVVCLKALEKSPRDRYPTIGDLAADLRRFLDGEAIAARPLPRAVRALRWVSRRRRAAIPVALALAAAVGLAAWGWIRSARSERELAWTRDVATRQGGDLEVARAREEAIALLESGRLALDEATFYVLKPEADLGEWRRRVASGRAAIEAAIARAPGLGLGRYLLGRSLEMEGHLRGAEEAIASAVELDPGLAPARLALGRLLVLRAYLGTLHDEGAERPAGLPEAERRAVRAAAEIDAAFAASATVRDDVDACVAVGLVRLIRKEKEEAARDIREAIEAHRGRRGVESLHFLLAALTLTGDPEEARRACDRALETVPRFPLALFLRAVLAQQRGEFEASRDYLDRALEIWPGFVEALLVRGVAHHALGDLDAAVADATSAVALEPDRPQARFNRGQALALLGRHDEALSDYDRALAVDPTYLGARLARADLHRVAGRFEVALADAEAVLAAHPDSPLGPICRAMIRWSAGDLALALQDARQAVKTDPTSGEARLALALLLQAKGSAISAGREVEEAIRLLTGSRPQVRRLAAEARRVRAVTRLARGDRSGALADADAALALDPRSVPVLLLRAVLRSNSGDPRGALEDCARVLDLDPTSVDARIERGNAWLQLGQTARAAAEYDDALERDPTHLVARFNRGHLRFLASDPAGARADWTRLVQEAPPDSPVRRMAEARLEALGTAGK